MATRAYEFQREKTIESLTSRNRFCPTLDIFLMEQFLSDSEQNIHEKKYEQKATNNHCRLEN